MTFAGVPAVRAWSQRLKTIAPILHRVLVVGACSGADADPAAFSADDAFTATDAYFEAYNKGDADAALALLTTDATLTWDFIGFFEEFDLGGRELRLAWETAQGTVLTSPSCSLTDDQPVEGTTLTCAYDTLDAPTQAVDALPVPTTSSLAVT